MAQPGRRGATIASSAAGNDNRYNVPVATMASRMIPLGVRGAKFRLGGHGRPSSVSRAGPDRQVGRDRAMYVTCPPLLAARGGLGGAERIIEPFRRIRKVEASFCTPLRSNAGESSGCSFRPTSSRPWSQCRRTAACKSWRIGKLWSMGSDAHTIAAMCKDAGS